MKYFDDIEIGRVQTSTRYELTESEIIEFAKKWDPIPFHIAYVGIRLHSASAPAKRSIPWRTSGPRAIRV